MSTIIKNHTLVHQHDTFSFSQKAKSVVNYTAITGSIIAIASAILYCGNTGVFPLGVATALVTSFPPIIPIALFIVSTTVAAISIIAICVIKNSSRQISPLAPKQIAVEPAAISSTQEKPIKSQVESVKPDLEPVKPIENDLANRNKDREIESFEKALSEGKYEVPGNSKASDEDLIKNLNQDSNLNHLNPEPIKYEPLEPIAINKPKESIENRLLTQAQQGDLESQFELGKRYYFNTYLKASDNSDPNLSNAEHWLKKAADRNHPEARKILSSHYRERANILYDAFSLNQNEASSSRKQSFKYYSVAAEYGDAKAQFKLSEAYKEGLLGQNKIDDYLHYVQMAISQNYTPALIDLGLEYISGDLLNENKEAGLMLIQKAANLGDIDAICVLAYSYYTGRGCKLDKDFAIESLKKAINEYQGNIIAQEWLQSTLEDLNQRSNSEK